MIRDRTANSSFDIAGVINHPHGISEVVVCGPVREKFFTLLTLIWTVNDVEEGEFRPNRRLKCLCDLGTQV